ncbi:hypothetical protein BD770DRAFT_198149 [Pilaira anomala]|nr:hypothetical protein BD770DRAFT_198149 [Pilaira anomala]
MLPLPFEILELIFNHLRTKDLLQCQLTNKQWYKASVEHLYSNLDIETSEKSREYTRTISTSLRLGSYLKTINTHFLFETKMDENRWDEHGLLSVLIRQCPNLLVIECYEPDPLFWCSLSSIGSQGQHLSRLQCLPDPHSNNLELYIHTALIFKATLTKLSIIDNIERFGLNLERLDAYHLLLTQISEFKHLQFLKLSYPSDKQLGCFDLLIEACPHLQRLFITSLSPAESQQRWITKEPRKSIHPRPDIRTLICNWEIMNNESQLRYIIQKFPRLQCLTVNYYSTYRHTGAYCSSDTILEFLRYVMSIPKFNVEFELENQNLVYVWTKLIDMKEIYRDVDIGYYDSDIAISNKLTLGMDKTRLLIRFPLHNDDTELPHVSFFSNAGNRIRSLTINLDNFNYLAMVRSSNIYCAFTGINWIFEVLQLCPSLQELRFPLPNDLNLSSDLMLHTNVKKLTVTDIPDIPKSLSFLKLASVYLPNMKQLHLGYYLGKRYKPIPITVDMTHSSLDLIVWRNEYPKYRIRSKFEVYIKLKTTKYTKFYMGTKTNLSPINVEQYEQAVAKFLLCFDITCRSLIEFRINAKSLPSRTLKWTF